MTDRNFKHGGRAEPPPVACVWDPDPTIRERITTIGGCSHLLETGQIVLLPKKMAAALAVRAPGPRAPIICEALSLAVPAYAARVLESPTPQAIAEVCKEQGIYRPMHTRSKGNILHVHGRLASPYGDAIIHPAPVLFNLISRGLIADPTDPPTWWADIPVRDQYASGPTTRFFAWFHSTYGRFMSAHPHHGGKTHAEEADSNFDRHLDGDQRSLVSAVASSPVLSDSADPGGGDPLCPVHAATSGRGGGSPSTCWRRSWKQRLCGVATSCRASSTHTSSFGKLEC